MQSIEWNEESYGQKNGLLRQEYTRQLKERLEEKRLPVTSRRTLPPIPVAYEAQSEEAPREIFTDIPHHEAGAHRFSSISLSRGDWLILGLLFYFLFMTDETDYILVGILAYILLSD